jgi:tetratricopeptide (TPR) repeat protein
MTEIPAYAPQSRSRQVVRGLRPFLWWIVLVALLFAKRTHERLSEQTRLSFTATLQRQPVSDEVTASLDSQRITSGDHISIGSHQFTITHPKADRFSTNFSFWYGKHNLGEIALNRSKGTLIIHADPPANTITIRGPELVLTLTNSSGTSTAVPTDHYNVEVTYLHWRKVEELTVYPNQPANLFINPRIGTVQLSCNQANASFQMQAVDGQVLEAGEFPSTIRHLPEGNYKVIVRHHQNQQELTISVRAGTTNSIEMEFSYGAAFLDTAPRGAMVTSSNGRELGQTPLHLEELLPGLRQFELKRDGYERVFISLDVRAFETNSLHTNLISINYAKSVNAAREFLAAANYDAAVDAATEALQAKPNDPNAIAIQKEASGRKCLRQAETLGKEGDYTAAIRTLESVLIALPENEHGKQLLTEFKRREPEQIENKRLARLTLGQNTFEAALVNHSYQDYFDTHELKTTKPVKAIRTAILDALKTQPAFKVTRNDSSMPETFEIEAVQELTTILATSAGRRHCVIVGAQTRDDETQILFKVLEYKSEAVNKFSIGNLINAASEVRYVPIHSSENGNLSEKLQAQLKEGVQMVTERIQRAIGQTPTEKPQ